MIVNKYNKKCSSCNIMVETGRGFAYNSSNGWRTTCASTACHARLGIKTSEQKPLTRKISANGEITMPYDQAAIPLLRAMPGAKWNPQTRSWFVDVSPKNINRTLELAKKLCLEIAESLHEHTDTEHSVAAKSRADKEGLYPFQRIGVEFLSLKDKALLGDDMGCGKTIQALVSIPDNARVIVVCPAAVKYNWQDEALKWRPDLTPIVVSGKKGFVFPKPGQIIIINYDILPAYLAAKTGDAVIPNDAAKAFSETVLICDEAHVLKNYKTARSQKVSNLSRVCKRTWFLTGTPLMNRPFDLFGVLSAGGMEREVFGSFNKFLALFDTRKDRYGGYHFSSPSVEVPERLRRVMLRRMKTEVLPDLPPKTYQKILVDVDGGLAGELDALYGQSEEFFSNGELPPFERFSAIRAKLAMSRVQAAHELVESYEDQAPIILFSVHKEPVNIFGSREGWSCITGDTPPAVRRNIVADFQAGKLRGLALTIGAGGVGLTLTRAATALFLDLDWTPALNLQAEDRIARIGQASNKVHIIHLVSRHVLDQHVHDLIKNKMDMIYKAIEGDAEYKPKALVYGDPSTIVNETEDELVERIKKTQEDIDRKQAKDKVNEFLKKADREFKLNDGRRELIRNAMGYMVGNCDGAKVKDNHGFNKPDARIAYWAYAAGLNNDDSLRLAESILFKYRNTQLNGYDDIWT